MRFNKKKLLMMAGAMLLPTATIVGAIAGSASATTAEGTGIVTCSQVAGGIAFPAPLSLPAGAPGGYGAPVTTHETVNIHLGDCANTGGSPDAVFTGLNGDSAIDGIASGTITSHSNNIEGLAGSSTPFTLTVTWYGTVGGVALHTTTVTVAGDQAYEGLVNDAGNVGFFLGSTTNSGYYLEPEVGPAGFESYETTSSNDMPANDAENCLESDGYAWPCFPTPGGSISSVEVTPKASASGHTNTLCIADSVLGTYGFSTATGEGYSYAATGVLGEASGNLQDDPIEGLTGGNPGDYITSSVDQTAPATNSSCSTQLGVSASALTLANPFGAPDADVTTSGSPSSEEATIGLPQTVSGLPGAMGTMSTTLTTIETQCPNPETHAPGSDQAPANVMTYLDNANPADYDSLCVLADPGGYTVPNGVGKSAVWTFGPTANDIPAAATAPTEAFAVDGCTTTSGANSGAHPATSCDEASATGSFADPSIVGDATTGFSSDDAVEGAATGLYNGYGGNTNPDPDGVSYMAIVATDTLEF